MARFLRGDAVSASKKIAGLICVHLGIALPIFVSAWLFAALLATQGQNFVHITGAMFLGGLFVFFVGVNQFNSRPLPDILKQILV
jgi:hypothetical protein